MTPTDSSYPIRDAFRRFFPNYAELHPFLPMEQLKVASSIMRCKTGELGYNVSYCDDCGYPLVHAVSCNNRSCPCCQAPLEKKWELERNTELISGIAYFHVVFTIPHDLNTLVKANLKILLGHQFKCVQDTLLALCADPKFMGQRRGSFPYCTPGGRSSFFTRIFTFASPAGGSRLPVSSWKQGIKAFSCPGLYWPPCSAQNTCAA